MTPWIKPWAESWSGDSSPPPVPGVRIQESKEERFLRRDRANDLNRLLDHTQFRAAEAARKLNFYLKGSVAGMALQL